VSSELSTPAQTIHCFWQPWWDDILSDFAFDQGLDLTDENKQQLYDMFFNVAPISGNQPSAQPLDIICKGPGRMGLVCSIC